MITEYHAKLFAHELSKRHSVADAEKLASALMDAQVDLNPHQVEAALFAFKSPLSKGAILADEVGLGKTIEAGLVLAQKWTEGRRRILVVTPANLRKQWAQEIAEKFFLPTVILEARNYNKMAKDGVRRPFEQKALVICSFQFAARHAEELMVIPWDLVVIDEAHRLRNVYRPDNRIGKLPRCSADINEVSGDEPAGYAGGKRRHPSAMNEAEHFGPFRLPEEGDHRNHDQQRLKPLTQQDAERAKEA